MRELLPGLEGYYENREDECVSFGIEEVTFMELSKLVGIVGSGQIEVTGECVSDDSDASVFVVIKGVMFRDEEGGS